MSGTQSVQGKLRIWSQQETSKIEELQTELATKAQGKTVGQARKGNHKTPPFEQICNRFGTPIFVPICSQLIDRHSHANLL